MLYLPTNTACPNLKTSTGQSYDCAAMSYFHTVVMSYFHTVLTKKRMCGQTSAKLSNVKFHKKLSGGSRTVPCRQTDIKSLFETSERA